jgi:hypothetical protein
MAEIAGMPMRLEYTSRSGARTVLEVEAQPDHEAGATGVLRERLLKVVKVSSGPPPATLDGQLLQRRVLCDGTHTPWDAIDALDNEIRIGVHLAARFEHIGAAYPSQLSLLVGWAAEGLEPFALFQPYRAEPCQRLAGRVLSRQEAEFEAGLFSALRMLEVAAVAHLGISPQTVRWDGDGRRVQLVDFSRAAVAGEQATPSRPTPWRSPHPADPVDCRDDIYSAGTVIHQMVTGRQAGVAPPADSENEDGDSALGAVLEGVFESSPGARPTPSELLRRLQMPDPWPGPVDPDDGFDRARAEFEAQVRRKRGLAEEQPAARPQDPVPAGSSASRRRAGDAPRANGRSVVSSAGASGGARLPEPARIPARTLAVLAGGIVFLVLILIAVVK